MPSDSRDLPFPDPQGLPDVFTTFRKTVEPLRNVPRAVLPPPESFPPMPPSIPPQSSPFAIPTAYEDLELALLRPLEPNLGLKNPPTWPEGAVSGHPFRGGEATAHE